MIPKWLISCKRWFYVIVTAPGLVQSGSQSSASTLLAQTDAMFGHASFCQLEGWIRQHASWVPSTMKCSTRLTYVYLTFLETTLGLQACCSSGRKHPCPSPDRTLRNGPCDGSTVIPLGRWFMVLRYRWLLGLTQNPPERKLLKRELYNVV